MRLLILGGTVFLGRHVAAEALSRGHEVTVFHRGRHGADLFRRRRASHRRPGRRPARARGRRLGRGGRHVGLPAGRRRGVLGPARRRRRPAPRVRLDLQRLPDVAGRAGERGDAGLDGGRRLRPEQGRERAGGRGGAPGPRGQAPGRPALRPARQRLPAAVVGPAHRARRRGARARRPGPHRRSSSTLATSPPGSSTSAKPCGPGRSTRPLPPAARPCATCSRRRSPRPARTRGYLGPRRRARRGGPRPRGRRSRSGSRGGRARDVAVDATRAEAAGLRCRPIAETVADVWAWLQAGGPEAEGEDWLSPHAATGCPREREREVLAASRGRASRVRRAAVRRARRAMR